MNKLRLIKIYEIRGKIHPMELFISNVLKNLESNNSIHLIEYMRNNTLYIIYDKNTLNFKIDYQIWNYFRCEFNCTFDESVFIFKYILNKKLDLKINKVFGRTLN